MRDPNLLRLLSDFFWCPNSKQVIEGTKGDDKVICGKTNPKVAALVHEEGVSPGTGNVHHIKRFLTPASADQWLSQERERAKRLPN